LKKVAKGVDRVKGTVGEKAAKPDLQKLHVHSLTSKGTSSRSKRKGYFQQKKGIISRYHTSPAQWCSTIKEQRGSKKRVEEKLSKTGKLNPAIEPICKLTTGREPRKRRKAVEETFMEDCGGGTHKAKGGSPFPTLFYAAGKRVSRFRGSERGTHFSGQRKIWEEEQ